MGHFNIKLDDPHTERFKELKKILKCHDNDEVVQRLVDIVGENIEKNGGKYKK